MPDDADEAKQEDDHDSVLMQNEWYDVVDDGVGRNFARDDEFLSKPPNDPDRINYIFTTEWHKIHITHRDIENETSIFKRYSVCNAHNMHVGFTSPNPGIDEATPLERLIALCFRTLRDWEEVTRLLKGEIQQDMKRQEKGMLDEWEELERENKKAVGC